MTYFQSDLPIEEFQARRVRVADQIGSRATAVIAGAGATGAFDVFRQTNEFYYLSGVEVPHSYLLIRGHTREATLYLPHQDAKHEQSEGPQLNCDRPDDARRLTGIEQIAPLARLADDVRNSGCLYLPQQPAEGRQACRDTLRYRQHLADADPWSQRFTPEQHFRSLVAASAESAELHDLSPILDELRLVKSEREIALMRQAGELTAQGIRAAMRRTRAGLLEYQLAAAADHVFADAGAHGAGYRPIVASGVNIWNAHYFRNQDKLVDGDWVLMDYAPEVAYYTSDIGRMWPVSGRYSDRQRELYDFVVEYHEILLQVIRPGLSVSQLAQEAQLRIRPLWEAWPFSKSDYRNAAKRMIESEVAFTHPVGMAVHDVGDYRDAPLRRGIVFALDPQLWVPSESIYVRVEDTVVVTDDGIEVLTAGAPRRADQIEAVMTASADERQSS